MTKLLKKAFELAAALPEEDQDAIGAAVIEEMESERCWQTKFNASRDKIDALAEQALAEYRAGGTYILR